LTKTKTSALKSEFPLVPLLALSGAYFIAGTSSLSVIGLVAPISNDLGVSAPEVAYLVSVFALTFAVVAPLGQIVFGALPRVIILASGMGLMVLASALAGMAETYTVLFLSRILLALGAAFVTPICSAIAAGLAPPALQGRAMGIVFGGLTIATVLGIPASSYFGTLFGWRWVMWGLSILTFATILLVLLTVRDKSEAGKITLGDLAGVVTGRQTSMAVLSTLLQMVAQFCTYALIAVYVVEKFSLQADDVAPLLMVFGVGGVFGNIIAGRLSDRIGPENVIWISCIGMIVGFVMLYYIGPSVILGVMAFTLWSVFGMMFQAPQQQRIANIIPEKRNLLLALNASALYLGMSLGSWVSSQAFIVLGWAVLPIGSVLFMLTCMLAFWQSISPSEKKP
jgi:MFS transporter, DHA1 family, inner membrane transport protein